MVGTSLRGAARRVVEQLRDEFGRSAMNRRILHRLTVADEADLTRLGLTRGDVREAAGPGIADAALFLRERRTACLEVAKQISTRRDETL